MRILYDYQIFDLQRYGGISRYFVELAGSLHRRFASELALKVSSPLYINQYLYEADKDLRAPGVKLPVFKGVHRLCRPVNYMAFQGYFLSFAPDVLHQTYYCDSLMFSGRGRRVVTVFDMIHELYPDGLLDFKEVGENKKRAVEQADHVICISENTRQDLVRLLNVPFEKTTVTHLGFASSANESQDVSRVMRPYILYVGPRGNYKNFATLLKAYANNSAINDSFDLIAFGGGAFGSQDKAHIAGLGLKEGQVVHVSGNDDILGSFYRNAELFVYPSLYEGFGIPPLEAMSWGCPVACSNSSSLPEVVGDAAMYFDPSDPDSIGFAMSKVLADTEMRSDLRMKGFERVKLFSWDRCADATLDVYREVCS